MLYVFFFIVFLSLAFLDILKLEFKVRNLFYFIFVSIVIFLSTIRWETGADWESYYYLFGDAEEYWKGKYVEANQIEFGYVWLNYIVSHISPHYTVMLLVNALLAIGIKSYFIRKEPGMLLLVFFFYYCYYIADIASVRQFVASSFVLMSSYYIGRKNKIAYLLSILLACSIHYSAIIFVLAYWLYWCKTTPKILYIILVLSFLLGFFNIAGHILEVVLGLIPGGSFIQSKLMGYQDDGLESASGNPYLFFALGAAKRLIVMPFFIWRLNYIAKVDFERYRGYLNLVIFGNIVYFVFILSIPVMQRLSVYFSFFEIFIWGFFILSFKDRSLQIMVFVIASLYGAMRLYLQINSYYDEYVPFKTIFSEI
ncbi:EpsG family protein [Sphingobacterium faecium]